MQFVGGNADFGTETEFKTVGEARRCVHHDRSGIHFAKKSAGARQVLGDDGIGMLRAIHRNVVNSLIEVGDNANRQYGRQVFGVPVFFTRRLHLRDDFPCGLVASQFNTFVLIDFSQRRQHARGNVLVHQQGLHGVAGAVALGLGVVGNANRLVQVRPVVDVDMANAIEVLEHRDARFGGDAFDESLATARHDDIHVVFHRDQFAHGSAIRGLDHLHRGFRQACRLEARMHAGAHRLVGVDGFGATTQNRRVSGFQAQAGGICGHIRARFINDADDSQRHTHSANLYPAGPVAQVADLAYRVGQLCNLAQTLRHGRDTFRREGQAIDQGRIEAPGLRRRDIPGVGLAQARPIAFDDFRHRHQRMILRGGFSFRDAARRVPRRLAHRVHVGLNIHSSTREVRRRFYRDSPSRDLAARPSGPVRGSTAHPIHRRWQGP